MKLKLIAYRNVDKLESLFRNTVIERPWRKEYD